MKKIVKQAYTSKTPLELSEFIHKKTGLSKSLIKKNLNFGGCWLKRKGKGALLRVRRASLMLNNNDYVEFYYDSNILNQLDFKCDNLYESREFGIWLKPAGILGQGTKYGDGNSLLRYVEKLKRDVFLIHRLDRETAGLMVLAYNSHAASILSALFKTGKVDKFYQAEVLGIPTEKKGIIIEPVDEKEAKTSYKITKENEKTCFLDIQIFTGRTHQIRKHMEFLGHPVIGDPKYGQSNKNKDGLKLLAYRLNFFNPFTKKDLDVCLEEHQMLDYED